MFTLTKIYAQANSRNVNIATSGVVKHGNIRERHNSFMASNTASCGTHAENGSAAFADALDSYDCGRYELDGFYVSCSQVETYLSNDGLHGYTKIENLSTIIEIE